MSALNLHDLGYTGLYVGLGVALVPAAVTTLIACSKIIFIHIITNIALGVLTAGAFFLEIQGIAFVEVPFLWEVSYWCAILGGCIIALSAMALVVDTLFKRSAAPASLEFSMPPSDFSDELDVEEA